MSISMSTRQRWIPMEHLRCLHFTKSSSMDLEACSKSTLISMSLVTSNLGFLTLSQFSSQLSRLWFLTGSSWNQVVLNGSDVKTRLLTKSKLSRKNVKFRQRIARFLSWSYFLSMKKSVLRNVKKACPQQFNCSIKARSNPKTSSSSFSSKMELTASNKTQETS